MAHDSPVMTGIFSKKGVSLERLQTLGKVVQAGSIALAAKSDPVAQSLISRQINELEMVLGLELLDRKKKPFQPTLAAQRLADSCERFVREVEEVSSGETIRWPIKVGAGEWVIRELLVPLIAKQIKQLDGVSWLMNNLISRKIQEDLRAGRLDVGLAPRLISEGNVRVKELQAYGMKLVLPVGAKPDRSGWKRLATMPVVLLEGDGGFRRFLAEYEKSQGMQLQIGAECTSYSQAVDFAEAAAWAVFVPELGWKHRGKWKERHQELPGLDKYRHTLQLAWNERTIERRPEVERLVKMLGG